MVDLVKGEGCEREGGTVSPARSTRAGAERVAAFSREV
jgi:hypothetical protein